MKFITNGHWIFAGVFALAFVTYLVWSYRKDFKINNHHYKGSSIFLLIIFVTFILLYIFRGTLK